MRTWGLLLFSITVGCAQETVVHNLDEKQANQIIELLANNEIVGSKIMLDTGRVVSYSVATPGGKKSLDAIRILNEYEMPRRPDNGYLDVFKESGLIPTAAEERAKGLAAMEGEIEKQLKLVDGILDAQVNLVIPEENALRTAQDVRSPATASVTIKYLGATSKPLSEPQVQAIVAAGVERLTPDNVVVVMTPSLGIGNKQRKQEAAPAAQSITNMATSKAMMPVIVGAAVIVGLLILLLVSQQMRLGTTRDRLNRLQSEIAKARRKPGLNGDGPPPPP